MRFDRTENFEQLVLEYQNLVYTVCFNILKNPHDAENVAQETFLSAYLNMVEVENPKSWLCKIATNKSIDFKRKNFKIIKNEESLELAEFEMDADSNVEALVERSERAQRLNAIILQLPEKYANAIRAFYFEALSVKEIAKYYKLPEKTVETQLYRARKMIRERWGEYETGY
ncbi:MAG: RNA polymerase sigma factor [Oscillospiraceae bacterium]|nr:RNA polymerase sigma factor [Oscillospiraceae bacterium]